MAEEANNPIGDLYVSLVPTRDEARRSGGRYAYQQFVVSNLIKEFGFEELALVTIPPCARFQLNSGTTPYPRPSLNPVPNLETGIAGEAVPIGLCLHLGYVSDSLIIRGVHRYRYAPFVDRDYRHQWTESSEERNTFENNINIRDQGRKRP